MTTSTRSEIRTGELNSPPNPGAASATILIVDDRLTDRRLLRIVLGHAGYRLIEASNGLEALELTQQRRPDLVITDILMPVMDGYELVLAIRQRPEIATTRVILYSATYRTEDARILGIATGASRFITKPTDPLEMLSIVETVLSESPHEPKAMPSAAELERAHYQLINEKLVEKAESLEREIAGHERTQRALEERVRLTSLLAAVQTALCCSAELRPMLQRCVEEMVLTLGGACARIWTLDGGNEVLELQASTGPSRPLDGADARIPMGQQDIGMIAQERKPRLTNAASGNSLVHDQEWVKRERLVAFTGYPLLVEERLVGVMDMFSRRPFSETEVETLAAIATGVALGIERKRTAEAIYEHLRLLDLAHDAIAVCTFPDHKIVFWNKGAERLYGWSSAEAMGRSIKKLFRLTQHEVIEMNEVLLNFGEWHGEREQLSKDDCELIVSCRATLVRDTSGEAASVLMINTDLTEGKALEARFLRVQRMESIGTLASGVAHDLNNILSPILLCASLLRDEMTEKSREELVSTIETAAQRGVGVVKQVLAFGRGVDGVRALMQVPPLLNEITNFAQNTFPKNIQVSSTHGMGLWLIEADPTQFHQVLLNLCINARDAMPGGGILMLKAENVTLDESFTSVRPNARAGPYVLLTVADTGTGIPQHVIDKMFDPFFTTKEIGKGTGLGLFTVASIVATHQGIIDVQSEVERGTTFKIYLPATDKTSSSEPASAPSKLPRGNGEMILVVDDELAIRDITAEMLRINGYKPLVASDGVEALALFTQHSKEIKLVLTDLMMPLLDGVGLTRAVRTIQSNMPIIASTGLGEESRLSDLRAAGAQLTLIKPYDAAKLLVAVGDALKHAKYSRRRS
ncbi:MAG: hypothetical protein QOE70_5404 [Chthoniobacter sp.]|jgi:PAS domain S-box-containing protein|nr:hypothetical protein [Chthoniobacter sp.]